MASEQELDWVKYPDSLSKVVELVKRRHSMRLQEDKAFLRLRYQRPVIFASDSLLSVSRLYGSTGTAQILGQLGFNTVRKVIDATRSRICKQLRPVVMSVGGELETEHQCTLLTRAVDGVLDAAKYWSLYAPMVFADACTTTIGHLEWFVDAAGEIRCDRLDPLTVFWDYDQGMNPADLFVEMPASKVILESQYPEKAKEIRAQRSWTSPSVIGVDHPNTHSGNTVKLCKAWRRRIGEAPGRYTVTVGDSVVLVDQEYNYDFFPLVGCRWDHDHRGYGGYAGAAVLAPYQRWRNVIMELVYNSLQGAVPWVIMSEDEILQNVSDVPFQKVMYSGSRAPQVVQNNPVSEQALHFGDRLDIEAHAEFGMNVQAAEGNLPAGLTSAPGQRERIALIDSRLSRLQSEWENLATESARVIIALASAAYRNKKIRVKAPGTELFDEIKWPMNLKENQYVIQFAKMSGLSSTAWGRKQEAAELRDRGAITEGEYLRMLELPDIKAASDRINAAQDLATKQITAALERAEFIMPLVIQGEEGLSAIVRTGTQTYQRALVRGGYEAANLACLRRLIQAADVLLKGPKPPTASMPLPVPAVLPGQPAGVEPAPGSVLPPLPPPLPLPPNLTIPQG